MGIQSGRPSYKGLSSKRIHHMLTSLVVSCCLHRHHCQCGFFKRARSMSQLLGQEKPATKVQASASPTKSFKRSTLRSPQRRFLGKGSSGHGYITILRYTKKTEHVRQNMIHTLLQALSETICDTWVHSILGRSPSP